MTRPAHADPTLWNYEGRGQDDQGRRQAWSVAIVSPYGHDNPTAHRVVDDADDGRLFVWRLACGNSHTYRDIERTFVEPRHAAQYAVPCLTCWPHARPGRESTERRRAGLDRDDIVLPQRRAGAWHRDRWGDPGRVTLAAKLAEEVGEVCEAAVKQAQGHPKAGDLDYGAELADVVIVAVCAADLAGVDLGHEVASKLDVLTGGAS